MPKGPPKTGGAASFSIMVNSAFGMREEIRGLIVDGWEVRERKLVHQAWNDHAVSTDW